GTVGSGQVLERSHRRRRRGRSVRLVQGPLRAVVADRAGGLDPDAERLGARRLASGAGGHAQDEEDGHRRAGARLRGFTRRVIDRPKLTVERTFRASIDEVWELWTTKDGIESWWGPDGFSVAVRDLDLRPG